ncbi:MAG: hypothetical protein ACYTG0_43155, partial [Planctomycetota bacterium]
MESNPFALFGLGAKVARHRHLSKRAGSGSIPAASTIYLPLIPAFSLLFKNFGNQNSLFRPIRDMMLAPARQGGESG